MDNAGVDEMVMVMVMEVEWRCMYGNFWKWAKESSFCIDYIHTLNIVSLSIQGLIFEYILDIDTDL